LNLTPLPKTKKIDYSNCPKADTDALHIAVASRHSIDFLLTWNCTHIANAEILVKINHIVTESGYFLPTICTPDELFGGEDYE
jgi:hypothetical protein